MILDFNELVNGSSLLLPAHPEQIASQLCGAGGKAGARAIPFLAALFAKQKTKFGGGTPEAERFAFATGQEARAGREFISPTPPFLPAPPERSVFCSAFGGAISQSFVQKRFELRSAIATNLNIANFACPAFAVAGSLFALPCRQAGRSPRLQRVRSLSADRRTRIFPYILGLNQTDGQNQKLVFYPAGGGSFQFFPRAALRHYEASFLIPRFFRRRRKGQRRLIKN